MRRNKYVKEWLQTAYYAHIKLEADKDVLSVIENKLASGTSKYKSDGDENHDADLARKRHEDTLADFTELKIKLEEDQKVYTESVLKVKKAISELVKPEQYQIAEYRYLSFLPWTQIIKKTNYSKSSVFRIHGEMLEEMRKILSEGKYE